jgi:glycosyltransferase involved in cell wall biosynthesis
MSFRACLVVPCYNEARRLDVAAFLAAPADVALVFVDDGSQDGTRALLAEAVARGAGRLHLLALPRNGGKGEAVRRGMLHALGLFERAPLPWIGFWDADLATPLGELDWLESFARLAPEADLLLGSRIYRYGSCIERSLARHVVGRLFATALKLGLGLESYDTQCGAKLVRSAHVAGLFREPFASRWIFDVEMCLRAERLGLIIVECPLREWRDVPGSKVGLRDAPRVALWLVRLWHRYVWRQQAAPRREPRRAGAWAAAEGAWSDAGSGRRHPAPGDDSSLE